MQGPGPAVSLAGRMEHGQELITAREAMERLALTKSAFYRLVDAGEFRVVHVGPRALRFYADDLHAYVRRNTTPPKRANDGLPKRSRARAQARA